MFHTKFHRPWITAGLGVAVASTGSAVVSTGSGVVSKRERGPLFMIIFNI